MSEVAVIATLEVEPLSRDQLVPIFLRHRERCLRDEPGTVAFEVLVPEKELDRVMLYQRYADRGALDAHWGGKSLAIAKAAAGTKLRKISTVYCAAAK